MGSLSFWHILVVAAVILAVFGHREIPALFGAIGRLVGLARKSFRSGKRQRPDDNVIEGTYTRRDD